MFMFRQHRVALQHNPETTDLFMVMWQNPKYPGEATTQKLTAFKDKLNKD
jgi:hypothetical protein